MKPVENWLVSLSPNCKFIREKMWLVQLRSGTSFDQPACGQGTQSWSTHMVTGTYYSEENKSRVSEQEFKDGTATQKAVYISCTTPWVNTISIIWELIRHANSWSHPRTLESESGRGKVRESWICVLTQTFWVILIHMSCIQNKEKNPLKILEEN